MLEAPVQRHTFRNDINFPLKYTTILGYWTLLYVIMLALHLF